MADVSLRDDAPQELHIQMMSTSSFMLLLAVLSLTVDLHKDELAAYLLVDV